jgi:AcrR family transcriptional regulator
MTTDLIIRARAGDGDAFRELAEPHRQELQVHCYGCSDPALGTRSRLPHLVPTTSSRPRRAGAGSWDTTRRRHPEQVPVGKAANGRAAAPWDAVEVDASTDQGSQVRAGYRRSAGSRRGEARRRELLDRVADDLVVSGLVDFSLRRAARAAGATHKVLLYYFDGADDLLEQAILQLRERRIGNVLAAAGGLAYPTLAARVRAVWPILLGAESGLRVLDQAIGLAMYDPTAMANSDGRRRSSICRSCCPSARNTGPTSARSRSPR